MRSASEGPNPGRFDPPRYRFHAADRHCLDDALFADADADLILLSAPAGYGKSARLAALYRKWSSDRRRVGWLTLSSEDAEPGRLSTAFQHAVAGPDDKFVASHPTALVVPPLERLSALLASDPPGSAGERLHMFLDGYDQIAGTAGAQLVADLVTRLQGRVRWVIASRVVSLRNFARLRAQGKLKIFDGAALRLRDGDYSTALGRTLTTQEERSIDRRLEGWPVAVQALKLELDAGHSLSEALSRVSGVRGLIGDFITSELFSSLPAQVVELLCHASILGQIDAPTADLLCERADSHGLLDHLDQLEPLIARSPTDSWRLHPLIHQHLEHQFDRQGDVDVVARRMTAFQLLAEREDYVGAVRNAVKAGRSRDAAALIGNVGVFRLWSHLGLDAMLDMLRMLPPALGTHQPILRFCEPFSLYSAGRMTSAIRLLDTIRTSVARDWRADQEIFIKFDIEWVVIRTLFDLMREVVSEEALSGLPVSPSVGNSSFAEALSFAHALLWTIAHQQWGELDQAARMVWLAEQAAPAKMALFNEYFFAIYRGWIAAAAGKPREAITNYRRMPKEGEAGDLLCLGEVMVAEALYMRGDFVDASNQIETWLPSLDRSVAWSDFFAAGYITAARIAFREGGLPAALAVVERLKIIARDRQAPFLLRLVAPLKLSLLMQAGAWKTARALEAEHQLGTLCHGLPADRRASSWRERDLLRTAMAEFHIHTGNTKDARRCIQQLHEDAEATGRAPAVLAALLLRSVLLWRQGSRKQSLALLAQLIADAVSGDLRGLLWDRSHLIDSMLEALRQDRKSVV